MPVTEDAREGSSLEDTKGAIEKFGPLKVVLRAIPDVYADHEVRQPPPNFFSDEQIFRRLLPSEKKSRSSSRI